MVISMDLRQRRAHTVIAELAEGDWTRLSCGDGAHGQRLYDWAAVDIRPWREPGCGHWLLARRSITDPQQIAYYLCFGPADTDLAQLVRVAGSRWAIEECFQTAKNEPGSTTTKSADTKHGIDTSPCPWPPQPSSSSPAAPRKRGHQ